MAYNLLQDSKDESTIWSRWSRAWSNNHDSNKQVWNEQLDLSFIFIPHCWRNCRFQIIKNISSICSWSLSSVNTWYMLQLVIWDSTYNNIISDTSMLIIPTTCNKSALSATLPPTLSNSLLNIYLYRIHFPITTLWKPLWTVIFSGKMFEFENVPWMALEKTLVFLLVIWSPGGEDMIGGIMVISLPCLHRGNICITFVQCWSNIEDAGSTLYKCYMCSLQPVKRKP